MPEILFEDSGPFDYIIVVTFERVHRRTKENERGKWIRVISEFYDLNGKWMENVV